MKKSSPHEGLNINARCLLELQSRPCCWIVPL